MNLFCLDLKLKASVIESYIDLGSIIVFDIFFLSHLN